MAVIASVAAVACSSKRDTTSNLTLVATSSDAASVDAAAKALPPTINIIDWPITWSPRREALALEYRRAHSDPKATDTNIVPQVIVLHYTGGDSAKNTKRYFDNTTIEPERKQLYAAGKLNVAAHFLVDRDGTIYRLLAETKMARHCIGLNHNAIGIENVGDENKTRLTDAQVQSNIALVRYLVTAHPTITHLLGHYEVMKFTSDPLFVELDPLFRNDKPDPGERFMSKVRQGLRDISLQGLGTSDK
jgi:N-acetylmuramoyl-L-alanine amidase